MRILPALAATLALAVGVPATALAAAGTTTQSDAVAVAGGWGDTATYIGKYRVVPVEATAPTRAVVTPAAGLFSLAVRGASQLEAASGPVSSGQLKTFLRKVKTGEPLAPSGILSIFGSSGTQVLYLTDLELHGTRRTATVDGGSFLGVPIGSLQATPGSGQNLNALITAHGLGSVRVRLVGFTAAPPSS